jgi:NADP-dependent 3-hydroxy acid dehydrogenase YdfG
MSVQVLNEYVERLSRWGRWGPDDQLGALNLVTADHVLGAAAEVQVGKVISMTLPYDQAGPQHGGLRQNPILLTTATGTDHTSGKQSEFLTRLGVSNTSRFGFSDDTVIMPTQCGTQWDALSHIFLDGQMWNGYSANEHSSLGASRNGIQHWTDRMTLRGVLIDVARFKGVASLEPGYAITVEDLEGALAAQGTVIRAGDALFVRTGQLGERRGQWGDYAGGAAPGMSLHTAPWLSEAQVVAIATDTWGVEVRPSEIDEFQPLHLVALVHMGLAFGEMFDLDETLERHGRLDVLVNNAAVTVSIPHADLAAATPEAWERILMVNVVGTWQVTVAAAAVISAGGHIINVTSTAGSRPVGSSIPYAVSKAALNHMTRLLATVLGPGIQVNAVAPGLIETPWTAGFTETASAVRTLAPLRRVGQPSEVAATILGLIQSPYLTGEVIHVDGGAHLI